MKQAKFILCVFIVSLIAFCSIILKYKTTYNEIDITAEIERVKKTLSPNQSIILLDSKNPFSFNDLLFRFDNTTNQQVYGILTLPLSVNHDYNSNSTNPLPAIIGVAGSKGWAEHHYGYMKRYQKLGFITLTLHSFKSRKVSSTVGEQISATTAMLVYDAYKALETLSNDQRVDRENIGITGWSLGGGVALFTAWKPLKNKLSPNHTFAAHLPIYPPCMIKPKNLSFTNSPIHILIGEDDNWVPADACVDLVESANLDNLRITTYPKSHHSFDRNQKLIYVEDAYSFTDCRLQLTNDGMARTVNLGFPLSNSILQKLVLAFCAERGAHYGGNEDARDYSAKFALDFMNKHLKNNY